MNLLKHILLSFLLGSLIFGLLIVIDNLMAEHGDIFSTAVLFLFPLCAIGLIAFYVLTSFHNVAWMCVNFAINAFVFQIQIKELHKNGISGYTLFVFCSFLWAINKLLIDKIVDSFKAERKPLNRLDRLIQRVKAVIIKTT